MVLGSLFLHVMLKKKNANRWRRIIFLSQAQITDYFLDLYDPAFNSNILAIKFDKSSNITNESDASSFENGVGAHLLFI